jgi:hypothetical protein
MGSSTNSTSGIQGGQSTSQNSRSGGSTFGQGVFNEGALNSLYGSAQNLYNQVSGTQQGMVPGAVNFQNQQAQGAANANSGMQQGGVYGGLGIGNQLMDSLRQSQNTPSNMQEVNRMIMGGNGNTSLDAMKGSLEADAARAQNLNQAGNAAQAAGVGMSGSSRQGVMDALGKNDINRGLMANEAKLGYDSFNSDLQRKMDIASAADTNTFNRQQLMSGMLGQQQGAVNQGIGNTTGVQQAGMGQFNAANQPWQGLQNYQNTLGAPTVLNSGSSYNTGQGSQSGSGWGTTQNSGGTKG